MDDALLVSPALNPVPYVLMETQKIGFIGGGNMSRSLIGGLIASGTPASRISVYDTDAERLTSLEREYKVHAARDNQQIVDECEVVLLAVKPQVMKSVLSDLKLADRAATLFITIAAGIRTTSLQTWLGQPVAIVRAMPNTPALVQSGATALFATTGVSANQRDTAESILRGVGLTLWVNEEQQMDAVTALSGSGPAYIFLIMEAMQQAACKLGLEAETARLLTVQTVFGAAKLALEIEEDSTILRQRVTSPGGTTEKAVEVFQANGLDALFEKALTAARDRSVELADQLGD